MKDLFGNELTEAQAVALVRRKSKTPQRRGYAAMPGTGPKGETCKTCRHNAVISMSKTFHKCLLMKAHWTGGYGTDILVKAPACRRWEKSDAAAV